MRALLIISFICVAIAFIVSCGSTGSSGGIDIDLSDLEDIITEESDNPEAVFKADVLTGEAPLVVHFNAFESSDPNEDELTYTWDFGDGNTGTGVTIMYVYSNPGVYEVMLKVDDRSGGTATASITIEVVDPWGNEPPVASITADLLSGDIPLEVLFTGSNSYDPEGEPLTFYWDFGDGDSSILSDPPAHFYSSAGTYTVTLTVEDTDLAIDVETVIIEAVEPPDNGVFVDEEEGIVAGLTLDENLDENSPVEIYGDPQWVPGVDGSAMEFNAEGEFILLPDSDKLDLTDQGAVEVWVYPYTNITAAGIVHKGVEFDYSDEAYSLQYNQAGQVAFIITNEGGKHTYVISNEGELTTYEWHHIVAAWDLTDVYLYIDGSLVTNRLIFSDGWKSEIPADFAPARQSDGGLMLGSQVPYNLRFDGIIDNVLIYDRVLDQAEVLDHYTSLAP